MRRIRYYRRLFIAFLARFKYLLLGSVIFTIAGIFLLTKFHFVFNPFVPTEKIGVVGDYSFENLPLFIKEQISVGLTRVDETGDVVPGLAVSWHHEEDGKIWIFKLGDYKWQDGTPVTATDVNYNFSDIRLEVIDKKTVKFSLQDPYAPFPTVVAKPLFKKGFIGVGEWQVSKFSKIRGSFTKSLRLVNRKTGSIRVYKFYPTEEAARTAFKLGEVDKLVNILDPKDLKDWPNVVLEKKVHHDQYIGIFMNTKDALLSSKRMRQVLAYAIDKKAFDLKRAISPIPPNSWAFNPQVKQYEYDTEKARNLLKEVFKDKEQEITKTVITLTTTPSLLPIAEKIKEYWAKIGIDANVQVANAPPLEFQALLIIDQVPPDPDQYSRWHSTQEQTNITHYSKEQKESQRIDKLLEDGRKTLNKEERKKIYLDFQRFLLEDLPVIPLFHPETYTISRK